MLLSVKAKKDASILNSLAYFLVQKSVFMSHHTLPLDLDLVGWLVVLVLTAL